MPEVKQVILVRKDLRLRKSAFAALIAKVSASFIVENNEAESDNMLSVSLTNQESQWLFGNSKRVILSVDSEDSLRRIMNRAELSGISIYPMYKDSNKKAEDEYSMSEIVCLALGPDDESVIDEITANLKLA